jgi:hypothetical protein
VHHRRFLVLLLSATFSVGPLPGILPGTAANPPQPDFFWPYGQVRLDGANIEPAVQPVIGLVNGRACGEATTKVAQAGTGVPPGDVDKTVYVVDVLADGSDPGHRPGCGRAGDPVQLYFPLARRIGVQAGLFVAGPQRLDVDLGPELQFRLQGPMVASDGVN